MVVVSDERAPVLVARDEIAALAAGAAAQIHAEGPLASLVSPRAGALASTPELSAALRVLAFPSRTLILQGADGVVVALCERDNAVATIVYGETAVRIGGVLPVATVAQRLADEAGVLASMLLIEHRRGYVAVLDPDGIALELRAEVLRMTLSGTGFTPGLLTPGAETIPRRAGDPGLRELDVAELRGAWDDDRIPSALLCPRRAITIDFRSAGQPPSTEVLLEDERARLVATWSAPGKLELCEAGVASAGEGGERPPGSLAGADPRRALSLADWRVVGGSGPAADELDAVVDGLLARDAVWWRRTTREHGVSHERIERWVQVGAAWYAPDSEGQLTAAPPPSDWPWRPESVRRIRG